MMEVLKIKQEVDDSLLFNIKIEDCVTLENNASATTHSQQPPQGFSEDEIITPDNDFLSEDSTTDIGGHIKLEVSSTLDETESFPVLLEEYEETDLFTPSRKVESKCHKKYEGKKTPYEGQKEVLPSSKEHLYKCFMCEFTAPRKGDLTCHVSDHTGVKPYQCTDCNYVSATKGHMSHHEKIHARANFHRCPQCVYRAPNKIDLARHNKMHRNARAYRCLSCGYSSLRKQHLSRHECLDQQPLGCSWCMYCALNDGDVSFRYREITNTGGMLYQCAWCEFVATKKGYLAQHENSHRNLKKLGCIS